MSYDRQSETMEDEHKIASLLIRWGHARDSGDWETLADCFHDDATIHISWISASAREFVERSRIMIEARGSSLDPGEWEPCFQPMPRESLHQDRSR
jgi:hypothetical protein